MYPEHNETDIVTPEAVVLDLEIAGLGSRLVASFVDGLIQAGIALLGAGAATVLVAANSPSGALMILAGLGATILLLGYHAIFEGLWEGKTPGKRAARLRVVSTDGQPVSWAPVLVRNAFRLLDQFLLVGALAILVTRRSQRIGDLAAATMVVHDRGGSQPHVLDLEIDEELEGLASTLDTGGITDAEYSTLRSFLQRRIELRPDARAELASTLAGGFRRRTGRVDAQESDERFLEAVAYAARRGSRTGL